MVGSADGGKYTASTFQKAELKRKHIYLKNTKIEFQHEVSTKGTAESLVPS